MRTLFLSMLTGSLIGAAAGCASSTERGEVGVGRRQLLLIPSEQVNAMAAEGYGEMKVEAEQKKILNRNPAQVERVRRITDRLIGAAPVFRDDIQDWKWETNVVTSKELNAFCMPGGKMMIYTGLIEQLNLTDGEIAAVMGHEIAHALREHGRERVSEEMLKQGSLQILVGTGRLDPKYAAAAGAVSALLLTLPHGRRQELEADGVGLELMARAGYNPEEAISLWRKMGAAGGGKPPEFLSTHPSDKRRIEQIEEILPKVKPLYTKK